MPTQPDMTTQNTARPGDSERPGDGDLPAAGDRPGAGDEGDDGTRNDGTRNDGARNDGAHDGDGTRGDEGAQVLDAMQHQVAVFARRAEQTRLGGVGQARNSMDRAAYLLLNRLDQRGPMGVKALASGMGIDSSTVTRQVAPLVDAGLVTRTSHPEDGRAVVLKLSPRGAARLAQVRSSRRDLMAIATEGWTEDERGTFTELLTRFNTALRGIQPSPTTAPPSGGPGPVASTAPAAGGDRGANGDRTGGDAGTAPA